MKFLVIAALVALLLLLLYSRLYPYIRTLQKILGVAKKIGESPTNPADAFKGSQTKPDKKLVRCVSCGTWIPAERAIGTGGGSSIYCSRECIEKASASANKKVAS